MLPSRCLSNFKFRNVVWNLKLVYSLEGKVLSSCLRRYSLPPHSPLQNKKVNFVFHVVKVFYICRAVSFAQHVCDQFDVYFIFFLLFKSGVWCAFGYGFVCVWITPPVCFLYVCLLLHFALLTYLTMFRSPQFRRMFYPRMFT